MSPPTDPRILLRRAPAGEVIYSCLAFHGPDQGGELPGKWIVAALESIPLAAPATRQALFRLEREGHLTSRREGRSKWYRLTATGEAQIAAGRDRLTRRVSTAWDGRWTVLNARFSTSARRARLQLLDVLTARGYARAGPGLFLHPQDDPTMLVRLVGELGLSDAVLVWQGTRVGGPKDKAFAAELFPLQRIAQQYQRFLRRFQPYAGQRHLDDRAGFALRLATALTYLNAAWDDPGLPAHLLPRDWPADRAQHLARTLYDTAAPAARRHAATIARQQGLK